MVTYRSSCLPELLITEFEGQFKLVAYEVVHKGIFNCIWSKNVLCLREGHIIALPRRLFASEIWGGASIFKEDLKEKRERA